MQKILLILMLLLMPTLAGAETIYLKDGRIIKAPITKDTGYSVQIMEKGFPQTFMKEQIDRIEPDQAPLTPEQALKAGEEALTPEKRDLVFRLLEANGARDSMLQMFNQIISQAPKEEQPQYQALFKTDEIIERLVPIYANMYTTQDLKDLISFYKSPLGEKHIKATPSVMQESLTETVKYFQEKMPKKEASPPAVK